jgi:serine/threonine protein kinase/WD40 repeat protein
MTQHDPSDDTSLPVQILERIDSVCRDFERAWRSGDHPRIEDYLAAAAGVERRELLQQLLLLDLDYRQETDDLPDQEEYHARFPQDGQLINDVFEGRSTDAEPPDPTLPSPTINVKIRETLPCRFGEYELLEEIAHGGMGVVYKARQLSLNRIVAVKMILKGQLARDLDVKRFHVEAEAAAKLDHPNIVPIYEVGEHHKQHFFSMAYIAGCGLDKMIRTNPLPGKVAAAYMKKVAEAIHHAHEQGVVHRDLKPSNILIDNNDEPRITDFGLAKRVDTDSDLTISGQTLGTPSYMPPEQVWGDQSQVGPQSDVYALGAVLYCLITGRPPFVADSTAATLLQVTEEEVVAPRRLNPSIDRDLETISLKCLEKVGARRYATCGDLAMELGRYLDGKPLLARPASRSAKTWRWCKRNPSVAALSAAVVFSLLAGVGISSYFAFVAAGQAHEAELRRAQADAERVAAERSRLVAQRQMHRAQMRAYEVSMISASNGLQAGNTRLTRRLLERHIPTDGAVDFRGFEWYYLHDKCDQSTHTLLPESEAIITCLAFSEDGRFLAAGGATDGKYQVGFFKTWDTSTWRRRVSVTDYIGSVSAMAFSESNSRLALGWGGTPLSLAPIRPGAISIWQVDRAAAPLTLPYRGPPVHGLAFMQGDRLVAVNAGRPHTTMPGELTVWDIETRQRVRQIAPLDRGMNRMVLSRRQQSIATFFGATIQLFSVSGERLGEVKSEAAIGDIAFTGSEDKLVSVGLAGIEAWDASTLERVRHIPAKECDSYFDCVASADSQQTMIVGGTLRDGIGASLEYWDIEKGERVEELKGHNAPVRSLAFSAAEKWLASAGQDGSLKIWRYPAPLNGSELRGKDVSLWSCLFSKEGTSVVTVDDAGEISAWSLDGKVCKVITKLDAGVVGSANMQRRPGTDTVVVASRNNTVVLCDLDDGSIQELGTTPAEPFSCAFSNDGSLVAVSGGMREGFWRIWRIKDRRVIAEKLDHVTTVYEIAFAPNGRAFASAHGDHNIRLWRIGETTPYGELLRNGRGFARSLCFSADSSRVYAGTFEGDLLVLDADSGDLLSINHAHGKTIMNIARSPDGRRLITSSSDGKISIWNAETLQELISIEADSPRVARLSPDGCALVATLFDQQNRQFMARIWDPHRVRSVSR